MSDASLCARGLVSFLFPNSYLIYLTIRYFLPFNTSFALLSFFLSFLFFSCLLSFSLSCLLCFFFSVPLSSSQDMGVFKNIEVKKNLAGKNNNRQSTVSLSEFSDGMRLQSHRGREEGR